MDLGLDTWTEAAGRAVSVTPATGFSGALVGRFKRGPTNKALYLTEAESAAYYGGTFNDEAGPIHRTGYYRQKRAGVAGADLLLHARVVGSNSKVGSRRFLDMLGLSTLVMFQRNAGAWGSGVSVSNVKVDSITAVTAINTGGTIAAATAEVGVTNVGDFEVGDVFYATDGAQTAAGVVWAVDAANSLIKIYTKAGWCSGTVALGSPIRVSSVHVGQTTLAAQLVSGATTLALTSTENFKKGSVVLVQHGTAGDTAGTAPVGLLLSNAVDGVASLSAAHAGSTYPAGSFVTSIEVDWTLTERDGITERFPGTSMSGTYQDRYVGNVLGTSVSFSTAASVTTTTANIVGSTNAASVPLTSVGSIYIGDWYEIGTSPKILVQVKDISTLTIYFDAVGVFAGTISSGATVKPATATYTESETNTSKLVIAQEMNHAATGDSVTTELFMQMPRPVSGVTLTGGADGAAVTGTSQVIGVSTPGAKTGAYLFDDSSFFDEVAWIAIPDLDDSVTVNRAAVDQAMTAFCEDRGVNYITSTPATITDDTAAVVYRRNTLALNSRNIIPWYGRLYARHPDNQARLVKTSGDGFNMGMASVRKALGGAHYPAGNESLRGIHSVVSSPIGSLTRLDASGLNHYETEQSRGVVSFGLNTLWTNKGDGTKRQFSNVSDWANYVRKSLVSFYKQLRAKPYNQGVLDDSLHPAKKFFEQEQIKGALSKSTPDAFDVRLSKETSDEAGGFPGFDYTATAAGAIKGINHRLRLVSGSVRVEEAA